MTQNEVPCYTLISSGPDLEPISEAQFRADFQKGDDQVRHQIIKFQKAILFIGFSDENSSIETIDSVDDQRREISLAINGYHSRCHGINKPNIEKAIVDFLGSCA